ncbi:MAG: hypothetical protein MUQ43_02605 [Reinekea forsetii]|nr:hypothetical protein [Reinekea forsetii]MDO7642859.1 hypothetical protein [Reinekea forsetii]MDO7673297.1 hypothetical protein [Reinekea forsetii]
MKEIILAHDFSSVTGGATNNAHCYTKIATSTVTVQYHTRTSSGLVAGGRGDKHSDYKSCQGDTPTWKYAGQFAG